MKLVGRVPKRALEGGAMVCLNYPPFHVLVAKVGPQYCAIENACNHAGAPLSEGHREHDRIACPMHGYVFDLRTGKLIQPEELCEDQRPFVCDVEGDEVVVYDPVSLVISP
jgi:3-phenylpropionate/trans-cinnamate dioxygenase ferredoxin subunit